MAYQLILSSDTLDIGRQKLNSFMQSSSGVWSSDTYSSYSILSTQGANYNQANNTQYSFVTGKNNSANTGNFQVLTGGYKNKGTGSFTSILGGTQNSQTNALAKYNTVINGFSNSILEDDTGGSNVRRGYNVILNGKSNSVNGQFNTVIGSSNNIVGNGNFTRGASNFTSKNPPYPAITNYGPQYNTFVGKSNYIFGSDKTSYNYLGGQNNNIINITGRYAKHNFLKGKRNKLNSNNCNYNFLMGGYLQVPVTGKHIFGFGLGTFGNRLEPKLIGGNPDYQMFLGCKVAGLPARQVRIMFGSSPGAFLNSGSWQGTGADYGEYFEWEDSNPLQNERVGFFVEISEGKIRIAQTENVVGIVSKTTAFIGDSNQDYWSEMYLKDEWGDLIKEKFDKYIHVEKMDEDSKSTEVYFDNSGFCYNGLPNPKNRESLRVDLVKEQCKFVETIETNVLNPEYDHERNYVSRKDRPEWDVVGLLGKLRVRTSEPITGNAVDVDVSTGMAKNGTTYPVMSKNKEFDGKYGIVTVFFK